ncbi:MAG: hypothetical protein IJ538_00620 [Clostridia bacterium]|nr:hypothetical protein [Clostridia bacterium]
MKKINYKVVFGNRFNAAFFDQYNIAPVFEDLSEIQDMVEIKFKPMNHEVDELTQKYFGERLAFVTSEARKEEILHECKQKASSEVRRQHDNALKMFFDSLESFSGTAYALISEQGVGRDVLGCVFANEELAKKYLSMQSDLVEMGYQIITGTVPQKEKI